MAAARTPLSKLERTPSKVDNRTPLSAPGSASRAKEEKIFVTVRVRPLNKKEQASKDTMAWDCTNDKTLVYKGPSQDRANSPASYTFDKVFGPTCQTDTVYEQGAKDVALSALTGINATIFAYGQTSSGKTFTMRGVTESAVNDIYKHIENAPERDFAIKISAMEIYNEVVRDLLKPESGPLRLLDDPEKGTIIEKLEEETVKDTQHLRYLIGICEAQRQVGETSLNDTSSRSHQIIRLIIESNMRETSGRVKSFVATLNFVDLAGSERTAQTHAIGTRLKEGCHINRSLLTLTTVIRKLSTEKRSGHIPYRDSKLTRILQLSLGGNARTAIICTMSPALSHVEQTRNTLFFATCAKEVTNTAQVNMVIAEKQLVKNLQMEVARLEAELRTPDRSGSSDTLLMEKEKKIKQMQMEMEDLKKQRDLAQSQLDELQKKMGNDHFGWNPLESPKKRVTKSLIFASPAPQSDDKTRGNRIRNPLGQSSTVPLMLVNEIRKVEQLQQQLGEEANRALEVLQKEVACHKLGNQDAAETIAKLQAEIKEMQTVRSLNSEVEMACAIGNQGRGTNLKEEITRLDVQSSAIANLEVQLENVQISLDQLMMGLPNITKQCNETTPTSSRSKKKKKMLPLALSSNINRQNLIRTPCSPLSSSRQVLESEIENRTPGSEAVTHDGLSASEKATPKSEDTGDLSSREGTPHSRRSSSVNMKKMQKMFQNAAEENVRSIKAYVTELKERVLKLQYQKKLLVYQVLELENEASAANNAEEVEADTAALQNSPGSWHKLFREQMQRIILLWDLCHVSIVHRTQFYLLFKGDPADQIYIEVELRRLAWLQGHFSEADDVTPAAGDDSANSLMSSIKNLREEREQLAKRMSSRLSEEERQSLYIKWQIPLDGKLRKLQLVNKLWTATDDPSHIEESARIVAKLVGFSEGGNNISKEMFELNFALPANKRPWTQMLQPISNLLKL